MVSPAKLAARYRAAVEWEAARNQLRLTVIAGRVTGTDIRRVKDAEDTWNALTGRRRAAA